MADRAEARLRASFREHRDRFLVTLENSYGRRTLNRATVNHSSFARFVMAVQRGHGGFPAADGFPLPVDLAGAWALGEPGDLVQGRWIARLRSAMDQCICSESIEDTFSSAFGTEVAAANQARIARLHSLETRLDLSDLARNGFQAPTSQIQDLSHARDQLAGSFPSAEEAVGQYLATFLQPNCMLDIGLARARSEEQLESAVVTRHFKPGDCVVRAGQIVDEAALSALRLLQEQRRREQERTALVEARRDFVLTFINAARRRAENTMAAVVSFIARNPWAAALSGCGLALLLLLVCRGRHSSAINSRAAPPPTSYTVMINPGRNETVFLPVQSTSTGIGSAEALQTSSSPSFVHAGASPARVQPRRDEEAVSEWRQQVIDAECRAEELLAKVRAGLAPELAKYMMDRLVQQLLAQRSSLLATCAAAAEHVAALEQRFVALHKELLDKLNAHEERASNLEHKLATKARENSELWRAVVDAQKELRKKN